MSVIEAFLTWYQQLHPYDQQALTNYLSNQIHSQGAQRGAGKPRFGGVFAGLAPNSKAKTAAKTAECPNCGYHFLINNSNRS